MSKRRYFGLIGLAGVTPVAQLLEALQDIPPLGPEVTAWPRHIEQPAVAVILELEESGGIVKGVAAG